MSATATTSVNWGFLCSNPNLIPTLTSFAKGETSGRRLQDCVAFSEYAGEVRSLLRDNGVEKARRMTRQALRRRNISI